MKIDFYLRLAFREATKSTGRFRLGAVVVKKGRVIGRAYNIMGKSHPIMLRFNENNWVPGIHAEVRACLGIPVEDLIGADIYVVRIWKDGTPALAKPCPICQRFIKNYGIRQVFYSTGLGFNVLRNLQS